MLKLLISILFLIPPSFMVALKAQPVNQTGFESFSDEAVFTKTSWESEGFTVPWVNGFDQNRAYVDDAYAHTGTKSLRIHFPSGQYGPANSGAQAPLMVPPAPQYYISYWLRFSDNFSWGTTSEGGKLPGLAGGGRCSGCATCTGTNGFSARLMWRTGGKAVLYLYHMDKAGSCGDNLSLQVVPGTDFVFQKGQWYQIIERVKINTGNNYDGEVSLWINEQAALNVTGIRFVNNGDQVDNLYFSTFHGGSNAGWAPTVDCNIWFDDVMITANASDIFTSLSLPNTPFNNSNTKSKYNNRVSVFPQPLKAGENFTLELSGQQNNMLSMEWIDVCGRSIHFNNAVTPSPEQQVPLLKKGLYILKIQLKEEVVCQKVLVE